MASQPVPVEACEGWMNPCSFCQRKFSTWIPIEEEDEMSAVPTEPGAFMFAFDNKKGKEVVAIGIHKTNIRTPIVPQLRELRKQISQKKFKETKASILLRYVILEDVSSKDACVIYAHWQNCGTLPRMTTRWPGVEILKNSENLEFCEETKKWCYPVKDPVWRKQKVNVGPQAVQKCKGWLQNCSYCDGKFTIWLPSEEAMSKKENNGEAPELSGLCMYAANKEGKRTIIHICSTPSIKRDISCKRSWVSYAIKNNKELEPDSVPEVRWMTLNNLADTNSCFMYAHFLNSNKEDLTGHKLPGAEILESSENFVFRARDNQWCYDESETSQSKKVSKTKERRNMLQSMLEDMHN